MSEEELEEDAILNVMDDEAMAPPLDMDDVGAPFDLLDLLMGDDASQTNPELLKLFSDVDKPQLQEDPTVSEINVTDESCIAELKVVETQANCIVTAIEEMREKIRVYQEKEWLTAEDAQEMMQTQEELIGKLCEFEQLTMAMNALVGVDDCVCDDDDEPKPCGPPYAPCGPPETKVKLLDPCLKEVEDEEEDSDDGEMPKVIVCGSQDKVPRVLVCEPLKKKPLQPHRCKCIKQDLDRENRATERKVKITKAKLDAVRKEIELLAADNAFLSERANVITRVAHPELFCPYCDREIINCSCLVCPPRPPPLISPCLPPIAAAYKPRKPCPLPPCYKPPPCPPPPCTCLPNPEPCPSKPHCSSLKQPSKPCSLPSSYSCLPKPCPPPPCDIPSGCICSRSSDSCIEPYSKPRPYRKKAEVSKKCSSMFASTPKPPNRPPPPSPMGSCCCSSDTVSKSVCSCGCKPKPQPCPPTNIQTCLPTCPNSNSPDPLCSSEVKEKVASLVSMVGCMEEKLEWLQKEIEEARSLRRRLYNKRMKCSSY